MNDKCFCHLNGYAVKDATARKAIEDLVAIVSTLNANIENLKNVGSEISNLKTEILNLNTRVTNLSVEVSKQNTVISSLSTEISNLNTRITNLSIEVSKNKTEIETLKKIVNEIETDDTITFSINSKTYLAEKGMDFETWVNTDYNTDGFTCSGENSMVYNSAGSHYLSLIDGRYVEGMDGIQENYTYNLTQVIVDNTITFTINSKTYQAERGMDFETWVNTDYNTDGFTCNGENSMVYNSTGSHYLSLIDGRYVEGMLDIEENYSYSLTPESTVDTISFYIGSTYYQAERGMDFVTWVNTDYNPHGYTCNGENSPVYTSDGKYCVAFNDDAYVEGLNGIEENRYYTLIDSSVAGN